MIIFLVIVAMGFVLLLTKGAFSPARLFAAMWTFLIIGYHCFSGKAITGVGLLWIVAAMVVLAIGEKLGVGYAMSRGKVVDDVGHSVGDSKIQSRRLFYALFIFIIISVIGKIIFLYANGYSLSVFFNFKSFLNMNAEMAYDRYHEQTVSNNFITLLSSFGYVAPICGGYLLSYTGKSKKRLALCLFSLFPVLLSMLMDNTKSGVIDAALLFAIGFMISFMQTKKRMPKIKPKHVVALVFLFAVLIGLLLVAMFLRIGGISQTNIAVVKEKIVIYAFGSVEAFDVWLSEYYTFGTYGFGVNTFMAPFNLLGLVTREQGVYGFLPGVSSNVFSAFRGVIVDFGIVGGLAFMFLIGFLGGMAYRNIRCRTTLRYQLLYALIMFFLIRSFLISPWIYTSFWIAFAVFLMFLYMASRRTNRKTNYKKCLNRVN